MRRLVMYFAISQLLYKHLGNLQPGANDVHVLFGCRYTALTLFLKAVQNEHCLFEFYGVDSAIRTAGIAFNYTITASSAATKNRFQQNFNRLFKFTTNGG